MITQLNKVKSRLAILQNIPKYFFSKLEIATEFNNDLFPAWSLSVFRQSEMRQKFKAVYDKYKLIEAEELRKKVVDAFFYTNQVEELCDGQPDSAVIKFEELPQEIRKEIKDLFSYLYETAIRNSNFERYVNDNVEGMIGRFVQKNKLFLCPFCGLETLGGYQGESRISLDHWLCRDIFPMASVNLNNLFPIGNKCNQAPVKGTKNVLGNQEAHRRSRVFYPCCQHAGVVTSFHFLCEPDIDGIKEGDWELILEPEREEEQDIFESWKETMNIESRYKDFFRRDILPMWEEYYRDYVEDPDSGLVHANTVEELKRNLTKWKATFNLKSRPGARLFRLFIDYLINDASEDYLDSLCENLKRPA